MAHASIQNSSFITKVLQHSHYHLSGDSEVSSCVLISLKPLKRRTSYKASFMQIQLVFWLLFSFYILPRAELSQGTKWPAVLTWVVGRPTVVGFCIRPCAVSVHSVQSPRTLLCYHQIIIYIISLLAVKKPLLCVGYSYVVQIILHLLWFAVSRPSTRSISIAKTKLLHLSMGVANTKFFACIWFRCHFPLQRFFSCLVPASSC